MEKGNFDIMGGTFTSNSKIKGIYKLEVKIGENIDVCAATAVWHNLAITAANCVVDNVGKRNIEWKTRNVNNIKLLPNPDSDAKEGLSPLQILRHDQYKWDRPEWRAYDYALLKFPARTFQVDHIFEIDNGWINAQKQLQGEKLLFAGFGANCTESNNNRLSFGINKLYQPPEPEIDTQNNIAILPKSWDFIVKSDNHFNEVHCVDKPFGNYSAVPHDGDRGGPLFRIRNRLTKPITQIDEWTSRDWHKNLILVGLIRRNARGIGDQELTGFGVFSSIARIEPQEFIKERMRYCGNKIPVPEHISKNHMQCTRPYVTFQDRLEFLDAHFNYLANINHRSCVLSVTEVTATHNGNEIKPENNVFYLNKNDLESYELEFTLKKIPAIGKPQCDFEENAKLLMLIGSSDYACFDLKNKDKTQKVTFDRFDELRDKLNEKNSLTLLYSTSNNIDCAKRDAIPTARQSNFVQPLNLYVATCNDSSKCTGNSGNSVTTPVYPLYEEHRVCKENDKYVQGTWGTPCKNSEGELWHFTQQHNSLNFKCQGIEYLKCLRRFSTKQSVYVRGTLRKHCYEVTPEQCNWEEANNGATLYTHCIKYQEYDDSPLITHYYIDKAKMTDAQKAKLNKNGCLNQDRKVISYFPAKYPTYYQYHLEVDAE